MLLGGFSVALVVGGTEEGSWALPVCVAGAALILAVAGRNDRLRVELRPQDVVVVNFWRTLRIPWQQVEGFGYDSGSWVRTTEGRQHTITAFAPPPGALPSAERWARRAVQEMERARRRRA